MRSSSSDSSSIGVQPTLLATPPWSLDEESNTNEQQHHGPRGNLLFYHCCKSRQEVGELSLSISIFALGKVIPLVFAFFFSWQSPIPYQQTKDGQVLLELDLSYELVPTETVSDWLAVVLFILLPVLILVSVGGFRPTAPRGDLHASLCFFFMAVGLSWFLTDMIKIYTSQLRPNFYEMCNFNKEALACETESAHLMVESRRSFPSGHASLAFSSMSVLALYFVGKVGIQRRVQYKRPTLRQRVTYLLSFVPMLVAFFVAASRVHDFWHHPADIVTGAAIGSGCTLSVHGMWYVPCRGLCVGSCWMLNSEANNKRLPRIFVAGTHQFTLNGQDILLMRYIHYRLAQNTLSYRKL